MKMFDPDFEIVPHGADANSRKIGVDLIIETHLAGLLECFFHGRNQHRFVIAFGDVALACEGQNPSGESLQRFDHFVAPIAIRIAPYIVAPLLPANHSVRHSAGERIRYRKIRVRPDGKTNPPRRNGCKQGVLAFVRLGSLEAVRSTGEIRS